MAAIQDISRVSLLLPLEQRISDTVWLAAIASNQVIRLESSTQQFRKTTDRVGFAAAEDRRCGPQPAARAAKNRFVGRDPRIALAEPGADATPVPKVGFMTRVGDLGCGVGYYK
jgi:hypothetical protein